MEKTQRREEDGRARAPENKQGGCRAQGGDPEAAPPPDQRTDRTNVHSAAGPGWPERDGRWRARWGQCPKPDGRPHGGMKARHTRTWPRALLRPGEAPRGSGRLLRSSEALGRLRRRLAPGTARGGPGVGRRTHQAGRHGCTHRLWSGWQGPPLPLAGCSPARSQSRPGSCKSPLEQRNQKQSRQEIHSWNDPTRLRRRMSRLPSTSSSCFDRTRSS